MALEVLAENSDSFVETVRVAGIGVITYALYASALIPPLIYGFCYERLTEPREKHKGIRPEFRLWS